MYLKALLVGSSRTGAAAGRLRPESSGSSTVNIRETTRSIQYEPSCVEELSQPSRRPLT